MIQQRNLALDVFRGITVCFMIIVNNPGTWSTVYGPLEHAKWHGFTPTDLVFPSFLFAVGISMAFSFSKLQRGQTSDFFNKIIKRTLIIFIIGVLLNWFPFYTVAEDGSYHFKSIANLRILGVLQRIALCYLIASILIFYYKNQKVLIGISAAALLSYWALLLLFAWPGEDPFGLTNNAVLRLDLMLFGANHLYHGEGIAFDPEGLLSTVPAVVNVIAGYLTGTFILKQGKEAVYRLAQIGILLIAAAVVWNIIWPINKKIWTGSYVLLTVGLDLALLWILQLLAKDNLEKGWNYFFLVFGRNPLFIYILSDVLIIAMFRIKPGGTSLQQILYQNLFASWLDPKLASFGFAVFFMLICWSVGLWLDRKKIYIKV